MSDIGQLRTLKDIGFKKEKEPNKILKFLAKDIQSYVRAGGQAKEYPVHVEQKFKKAILPAISGGIGLGISSLIPKTKPIIDVAKQGYITLYKKNQSRVTLSPNKLEYTRKF